MRGNFSFDGETINDGDFNNFYADFVSAKPTGTYTPPTSGGTQYSSPIGTFATKGESSPVNEPAPAKKGSVLAGIGNALRSDTGQAILSGISKGIENQVGGQGGGGYQQAPPPPPPKPMSTGTIIAISVGALAVIGIATYFIIKR